jgi:diguanylate cyclase (GGDEF)-like protein/PAS domain S-box-containing protein
MSHPSQAKPGNLPLQKQLTDAKLLAAAYEREPLNLAMTAATAVAIGVLLWPLFPAALMSTWLLAILGCVALGLGQWLAFRRADPDQNHMRRWQTLFLIKTTLNGAAWALGPTLMLRPGAGFQAALLISILICVCAVAMISVAAQRKAMQAFIVTTLTPPALALWFVSGDGLERLVAAALGCGMLMMLLVGRRLHQSMRQLLKTQASLLTANQRLEALVEAIPDAIFCKDGDGRWLITNEPAKQLFHLHDIDWQNKTEMELAALHPELRAAHETCLIDDEAAWQAKKLTFFSEVIVDDAGQRQEFEVRKMPTFDEQGQRRALVIIGRDITTQKLAAAELRIAATAFEAQQGLAIVNANYEILRVNKAFTDITGYSAEEAIGQNPRLLSSGRHDASFYRDMWASIAQTGGWQGEIWNRRKNGEVFPEWLTISAVKDEAGLVSHYVAIFTEISSIKAAEDQIRHLAYYDPLTGLPNRRLLMERLKQALVSGLRHVRLGALLFIDLDNFKTLNDTLGHYLGDQLLEQVAKRLRDCVREGDTVARLGGDEFVLMLEDLSENSLEAATQAEGVAEKTLNFLSLPYQLDNHAHHSTCSVGVTLFGGGLKEGLEEPLKRADLAMYQAKAAGRNTLRFFDPQMQAVITARADLEIGLREAIDKQQLVLHYQPQISGDGHIAGAEALVRWLHPQRGMIAPNDFIPLAEDTGLILPLGRWVLHTACTQLARWATRAETAGLTIAVNVSARQFHQNDFVAQVQEVLTRTGANPQRLKLELTESLLVSNLDDVIAKMSSLKASGVSFSLDDFGTGYSSLSYLSKLPLDQLKIDRSFVMNIESSENAVAICAATISLAHSLKLNVVAEGVETQAQRQFLSDVHHCDYIQGYLFSRPLALPEFEAFCATQILANESTADGVNHLPLSSPP